MSCDCMNTRITNFLTGAGTDILNGRPVVIPNCGTGCCGCCNQCCCTTPTPTPETAGLDNGVAYNLAAQTVLAGARVAFTAADVNTTDGNIVFGGTSGFIVRPGTYLLTFVSDVTPSGGGVASAQFTTSTGPIADAATEISGATEARLTLNTIVTFTQLGTIGVINPATTSSTYSNTSLTIVKIA